VVLPLRPPTALKRRSKRHEQARSSAEAPRFLIRDNDGIYGERFVERVESMGIEDISIALYSPWQNPYCERMIGSIRRECLNHVIVLNENHLRRISAFRDGSQPVSRTLLRCPNRLTRIWSRGKIVGWSS